ncbi:Stk1 family PASTA domain-containing Ser/Thr kinase [Streptomyces roseolilacinus]|uniref:PASTA domain-containing protein n=1 Tax=Streptomyces roseolilacinus TaxID=66904 RepID=A0A918EPE8_9ACTN|nr:PASTA domain-containing protein [Streptomyces roseolilacinus]GGQ27106.1 hypothetical protein GCM10010249_52290 [Streptomyces roseolilacinus]
MSQSPPPHPPQWAPPPTAPPARPGWARKRYVIPAAVLLFFIGVGIGSAGSKDTTVEAAPAPTVTKTITATPTADDKPAATPPPKAKPSSTPRTDPAASVPPADNPSDSIRVPNFVGMGLQAAQDHAQEQGLFMLTSHDETGADRAQVLDRNWTVCSQDPAAGATVSAETTIDFGAVKLEETCP